MNCIEQLYYAVISGTQVFDGMKIDKPNSVDSEYDKKIEEVLSKYKIPLDELNDFWSAVCEEKTYGEYCGFKDGFKLGVRLVAEAFCDE